MKTCSVKNCTERHLAKGYCQRHYDQMRNRGRISNRTKQDLNDYWFRNNICYIQTYDNECNPKSIVLIDKEDYEKVKDYKWSVKKCDEMVVNSKVGHLSRFLTNTIDINLYVDHKNHNRLDNRKCNLRVCTRLQNNFNKRRYTNNISGEKGVSWHRASSSWVSQIQFNGKKVHLGYFNNIEDAARAYNEAAIKYHGKFALLNKTT